MNLNANLQQLRKVLFPRREDRLWPDLAVLVILFGVAAFRWHHLLHSPVWTPDGANYQAVIDLVLTGRSPYEHTTFPYPPTVAVLGAWITKMWGTEAFRLGFRYINLLGGCAAIWGSVLFVCSDRRVKVALGALAVLFLPSLISGLEHDNLSLLASGSAIFALCLWQRLPVWSGVILGFGLALKPVAVPALFVLAASGDERYRREKWVATAVACVTTGLLLSFEPTWFLTAASQPSVKGAEVDWASTVTNVSLFRILASFGLSISPFALISIVVLLSIFYVRTRPMSQEQLLCVACASSLLSLPIIWQHTLILITPVAFIATSVAVKRLLATWRGSETPKGRERKMLGLSQVLLIAAGSETILEGVAYGVLGNWHPVVNGMMLMIPVATLLLLTIFIVKCGASIPFNSISVTGHGDYPGGSSLER